MTAVGGRPQAIVGRIGERYSSALTPRAPTVEDAIQVASFRVALRRFFRISETAARESGLTPRQYLLLLLVKGAPDGTEQATVGDLCKRLHLAQSTVTELVSRAAEAGLVSVTQSEPDGRVSEIRLSREAERRLAECFSRLEDERARCATRSPAYEALPVPGPADSFEEAGDCGSPQVL